MRTLRVVVVDDHRLMLDALLLALRDATDLELVGETHEGRKALPLVAEKSPDVVLLDFRMPDMDGLQVLDRIRKNHPDVKVIMLSGSDDPELIQDALRRGASAFILKQIDPQDLPGAIRQAVEGTIHTAIGRAEDTDGAGEASGLTPKELDVLNRVARGLSNKEISKELWLSEQTIKFHLTNIYRKLGVGNRTEATRYAYQQGLVRPYEEAPFTPGS
jgi:DNA-binding NarL/FixJ family response regulator